MKGDKMKYCNLTISIDDETSIMEAVCQCFDSETKNLMIDDKYLSDDFFDLKTGLAGICMQKFINYGIKAAVVLNSYDRVNERFSELILELNKRDDFKFFNTLVEAQNHFDLTH